MVHAIIVAAGQGIRMSNTVRKQYIALDGIPILSRTLGAFDRCDLIDRIIVAVPKDDIDYCRSEIIPAANMKKEAILVVGGERRQDSVYNGLKTIESDYSIVRSIPLSMSMQKTRSLKLGRETRCGWPKHPRPFSWS